jgi:hypothetical protein
VPDAAVGALAYLVEAALALSGRLTVIYAPTILALGLAGVVLVAVQVAVVHALCALCLASAAISWVNVWLGRHDIMLGLGAVMWRIME